MDAVALQILDMVEFGNCRKCQKCTDFTQIHPYLALLRMALRLILVECSIGVPGDAPTQIERTILVDDFSVSAYMCTRGEFRCADGLLRTSGCVHMYVILCFV